MGKKYSSEVVKYIGTSWTVWISNELKGFVKGQVKRGTQLYVSSSPMSEVESVIHELI